MKGTAGPCGPKGQGGCRPGARTFEGPERDEEKVETKINGERTYLSIEALFHE